MGSVYGANPRVLSKGLISIALAGSRATKRQNFAAIMPFLTVLLTDIASVSVSKDVVSVSKDIESAGKSTVSPDSRAVSADKMLLSAGWIEMSGDKSCCL